MYLAKNPMYRSQSIVGKRLKSRLEHGGLLQEGHTYTMVYYKVANNDKNVEGWKN
jgi:hypothetical protein